MIGHPPDYAGLPSQPREQAAATAGPLTVPAPDGASALRVRVRYLALVACQPSTMLVVSGVLIGAGLPLLSVSAAAAYAVVVVGFVVLCALAVGYVLLDACEPDVVTRARRELDAVEWARLKLEAERRARAEVAERSGIRRAAP